MQLADADWDPGDQDVDQGDLDSMEEELRHALRTGQDVDPGLPASIAFHRQRLDQFWGGKDD